MKRTLTASIALVLASGFCLAATAAEATRKLEAEFPLSGKTRLVVENLAGSMQVLPGAAGTVRVTATVSAESDELADSVRLDKVEGSGRILLRVVYPLDEHRTIRPPEGASVSKGEGWLGSLLGGGSRVEYGGRSVKLLDRGGVLLYADVRVEVPVRDLNARFSNLVGPLRAEGVGGDLVFETESGGITLGSLRGEIRADTGSGGVKAKEIEGSFTCDNGSGDCDLEAVRGERVNCDTGSGSVTLRSVKVSGEIRADTGSGNVHGHDLEGSFLCDTGSGDCTLDGLTGESVRCDTGSGTVRLRSVSADRISADTGSGDVLAEGIDARELTADTGSGDVHVTVHGERLARVHADTGSGNVRLGLRADASFELRADTGSGDLISRFEDAQPLLEDKELVGYRRGSGKIQITADTGSGNVIVEPGTTVPPPPPNN